MGSPPPAYPHPIISQKHPYTYSITPKFERIKKSTASRQTHIRRGICGKNVSIPKSIILAIHCPPSPHTLPRSRVGGGGGGGGTPKNRKAKAKKNQQKKMIGLPHYLPP
ncbi:MAG: hypothetical protein ACK55Z_37780, partial [bacterium]